MVLVIDNYDSFTYNLVQYLSVMDKVKTVRNDKITIAEIEKLQVKQIVISPGPGRPENAGRSEEIINFFKDKIPILGVCLGHQCIGSVFGAKIIRAPEIFHGKVSSIYYNEEHKDSIFAGVKNPFKATRYHSLIVDKHNFPSQLQILARSKTGVIMALKHREYPIYGLQFHPESILTEAGMTILKNFLNLKRRDDIND